MKYDDWVAEVPEPLTADVLWTVKAYRLGLFASDLGWRDVTKLQRDRRTVSLANQLYRALGGISATIAEGYSRSTGKERARYYEFALGSAREARDHYYKGRHILGKAVLEHRLKLLTRIIKLTLTMIPDQRQKNIKLTRSR
ncbi:MAG TPA: four helix bundle protein [Tepidisphaeraceae bacterium]|nr:four helix bundle protein [Tepidisphaeraceae bacterium]